MSASAGPSACPTKASNQVENVLEAEVWGCNYFLRDYQRRIEAAGTAPTCFSLGPASDMRSPGMALLSETKAWLPFPYGGGATSEHRCCRKREFGYNSQVSF